MIATFLLQQLRSRVLCRLSLRELRHLSDRELDDLGLARAQVTTVGRSREDV